MIPSGQPLDDRIGALRPRWLADAVISGFVAIGAATAALIVAYALANGIGTQNGDFVRQWLFNLTHNQVVAFSQVSPALALALHVVFGLMWALIYAWVERFIPWPGWIKGMTLAIVPWLASLFVFLPATGAGPLGDLLGAGPLPLIGNFLLHAIYGFSLGKLYDSSADEPAVAEDQGTATHQSAMTLGHSSELGAAGIAMGVLVGAVAGTVLSSILTPILPNVNFGGWSIALAVAGILAGGAVGAVIGSFAGLPTVEVGSQDLAYGDDSFQERVLPFLLPLGVFFLIAAVVVALGLTLYSMGKSEIDLPLGIRIGSAVIAALAGTLLIGLGALALVLAGRDHESVSTREPAVQSGH